MESLTQLRCRTQYSFGEGYGRASEFATRLAQMQTPAAGIVDTGTWGHVPWSKALKEAGVRPMFGVERPLITAGEERPRFWLLARDATQFYATSTALHAENLTQEVQLAILRDAEAKGGCIRFAGAALTDPDTFDYIDINPASALSQQRALALHKKTRKPLVITSSNIYASVMDQSACTAMLGHQKLTPKHVLSLDDLRQQLSCLTKQQFEAALRNTNAIPEMCMSELPKAPIIKVKGDIRAAIEAGRKRRLKLGHIAKWTKTYQERLDREIALIEEKKFASYFLVVADLICWAKERMLVGPARGSSAGSLVCYLLRITEVDPLIHDLLFERFIDVSRSDLPDIDIDFSEQELVWGYLAEKYGKDKTARIGNINTRQARTVIGKVCKQLAIPEREKYDVLNVLIEYSSGDSRYGHALEDTFRDTEPGKRFMAKYPEAELMFSCEHSASHTGVHAAGVVICNEPISHFCTVGPDGVAQLDKPGIEELNMLKIDALGLRTLAIIKDAGVVTAEELYALKLDDPKVFKVFNDHHYAAIFQFDGQTQRRVAQSVTVKSFKQIDHITALARPGPLGGGASQKYIVRARGEEPVEYRHPSMKRYLQETMGVVLYQEQVMRICSEIGCFDWKVTSEIRKAMSGRKGKEYFDRRGDEFVAGALTKGLSAEEAKLIWSEICTFGAWGMNKSHTVSYSIISYWCAWMKCYHPLQYFAACLRNAKDEQHALDILREAHGEGINYTAFDPLLSDVDWAVKEGKLVGGFQNLIGYGPAKATAAVKRREQGKLDIEALQKYQVRFSELFPFEKQWKHAYDDPTTVGCAIGSKFTKLDALPEGKTQDENVLLLVKVMRKELRDENEHLRLARRNGKRVEGQTLFLDIFVTDDSGIQITLRIDRFAYEPAGRLAAERLVEGDVLIARGRRIPNFAMVKVAKEKILREDGTVRGERTMIKCISRKGVFDEKT